MKETDVVNKISNIQAALYGTKIGLNNHQFSFVLTIYTTNGLNLNCKTRIRDLNLKLSIPIELNTKKDCTFAL